MTLTYEGVFHELSLNDLNQDTIHTWNANLLSFWTQLHRTYPEHKSVAGRIFPHQSGSMKTM
jgi:hypothetical protein